MKFIVIYCCEEAISQCSRFLSFLIHFYGIVHFRRLIAIKPYYHVKWNQFESLRVIIMEILAKSLDMLTISVYVNYNKHQL